MVITSLQSKCAGLNFVYKGIWSSNSLPANGSNGDTYSVTSGISVIFASPGDYISFRNGNWATIAESNEMSVSADGKIYFSSAMSYLFLSEI
jgi:hypothetical protein